MVTPGPILWRFDWQLSIQTVHTRSRKTQWTASDESLNLYIEDSVCMMYLRIAWATESISMIRVVLVATGKNGDGDLLIRRYSHLKSIAPYAVTAREGGSFGVTWPGEERHWLS